MLLLFLQRRNQEREMDTEVCNYFSFSLIFYSGHDWNQGLTALRMTHQHLPLIDCHEFIYILPKFVNVLCPDFLGFTTPTDCKYISIQCYPNVLIHLIFSTPILRMISPTISTFLP